MTMDAVAVSEGWVIVALFLVLCLSAAKFYGTQKAPRRWPLLGFLPSLIYNFNDFYEWSTHILILNRGTVAHAKGAWTNWVVTADPTNVEYIMKIKFHNFVKGNESRKVFGDVFGVMAIFLQDGETWRQLRTTASTLFASMSTRNDVIQTTSMLVHQRLIPLFQHAATEGTVLDLEDIFHRYGFDSVCNFGLGFDPGSLALDLPLNHFAETYDRSIKLSVRRLFVPSVCWKTLRFLNLGTERQMRKDRRVIDDYIGEICAMQRQEMAQNNANSVCPGFLPLILRLGKEKHGRIYSDDELRDTCLSIILAGRDTTGPALAWFFWLLQQHPEVEDNILMELRGIIRRRRDENDAEPDPFTLDELREMNYLQAALSESLRLYPSVPIEILEVVNDDVLPDGNRVKKGSTVMCQFYSMARMESIWGADCCDFNPDRWLRNGKFVNKSEFIYPVFNQGPRRCLGRDVANLQMKWVSASIILRYCVKPLPGHPVVPKFGLTLRMKCGFKVKFSMR